MPKGIRKDRPQVQAGWSAVMGEAGAPVPEELKEGKIYEPEEAPLYEAQNTTRRDGTPRVNSAKDDSWKYQWVETDEELPLGVHKCANGMYVNDEGRTVRRSGAPMGRPAGRSDKVPRKISEHAAEISGKGGKVNAQVKVKEGEMAEMIRFALNAWNLPPVNVNDPDELEERAFYYFKCCIEQDHKPGIAGLCNYLGIRRATFLSWASGVNRRGDKRYVALCEKINSLLEGLMEEYMLNGKINPVTGIFLLKNSFGYADRTEIVQKPDDPLATYGTREEIRERYKDSVVHDE